MNGMRPTAFMMMTLALSWTCGGEVQAADGTFRVRVHVPPRVPDALALRARLPLPEGAVLLTRNRDADSHAFADTPGRAARGYRDAMARAGLRLVFDRGDALAWEDARQRVEIRLQPVLGTPATTRVVLVATPRPLPITPRRD